MDFGEKIKNYRKENNFTQDDLAEKLHVSRQSISKWETGNAYPNYSLLLDIAKLLNESVDDLLSTREIVQETIDSKNKKLRNKIFLFSAIGVAVVGIVVSIIALVISSKAANSVSNNSIDNNETTRIRGFVVAPMSYDDSTPSVAAFNNKEYPGIYWTLYGDKNVMYLEEFIGTDYVKEIDDNYEFGVTFNVDYAKRSNYYGHCCYFVYEKEQTKEIVMENTGFGSNFPEVGVTSKSTFRCKDSYNSYSFTECSSYLNESSENISVKEYDESFQLIKETQINLTNYNDYKEYKISNDTLYAIVEEEDKTKTVIWNEDMPKTYLYKKSEKLYFDKYIRFTR